MVSISRLEDQKVKRAQGQVKRLQKHMDEATARAGTVIDMDAVADRLEAQPTDLLDPVSVRSQRAIERSSKIIIDITD